MLSMKFKLALGFSLITLSSCLKIPVEFTMNKDMTLSKEKIDELRQEIFDAILEIDLSEPTSCPEVEAKASFKQWLEQKFQAGLLPNKSISPYEYGAYKIKNHPDIKTCRHINIEEEYNRATEGRSSAKKEMLSFSIAELKDKIQSTKCTERFIDPHYGKIAIKGVKTYVSKNSLTTHTPTSTIYTSDLILDEEYIDNNGGEKDLVDKKEIYKLATTVPIPPHFTGFKDADLETDPEKLSDAEFSLVGLDGSVLVIVNDLGNKPEKIIKLDEEFFIIPNGEISLTFSLAIEIKLSYHDGLCVLSHFKDEAR